MNLMEALLSAKLGGSGGGGGGGAVSSVNGKTGAVVLTAADLDDSFKAALLDCFAHVAWTNEHGQDYYDALESALYPPVDLVSISAVYTQSGTVYNTDSLDSLRDDLVVTATYSNGDVLPVTAYTLSGTLTVGTSTITVSYGGKTATFDVAVTIRLLYSLENYVFNNETIDTGVALMDEDRDWSICIDVTLNSDPTSGIASAWRIFNVAPTDGSGFILLFGKGRADATATVARFMSTFKDFLTSVVARKHMVFTHAKNSGTMMCHGYQGTAERTTVTVSDVTFSASNRNLTLGGRTDATLLPTGTFHNVKVYNYVMSASEITAFLGK